MNCSHAYEGDKWKSNLAKKLSPGASRETEISSCLRTQTGWAVKSLSLCQKVRLKHIVMVSLASIHECRFNTFSFPRTYTVRAASERADTGFSNCFYNIISSNYYIDGADFRILISKWYSPARIDVVLLYLYASNDINIDTVENDEGISFVLQGRDIWCNCRQK